MICEVHKSNTNNKYQIMKLKYIYKIIAIMVFSLLLKSCSSNDSAEPLFNQTPTERLQARQKELNDALLSSEYGWKMVYFTDSTQLGGFTHLFKFKNNGLVDMASDFDSDTAIYNSEYQIQLGSTISLVFTTKNRIHLLSDSENYPTIALTGKGYKGDFQFLYYGQENGEIKFKTNTAGIELHFVKATAQDWVDLSKNIGMIANMKGNPSKPLFRLLETSDGTKIQKFDFTYTDATRFAVANSTEPGSNFSYDIGIAYTPTGIIIKPAIKLGNQELSNFIYDDVSGAFIAKGTNNVYAAIKYSDKPIVITDDYKELLSGNPQKVFSYISPYLTNAPTNSASCVALLNEINEALPVGGKLTRIQMYFNTAANGTYIEYRFETGNPSIYHLVNSSENTTNKTIVLSNRFWFSASAVIPEPAILKAIDKKLLDPEGLYVNKENFNIQFTNTIYTFTSASSPFRITTYAL
jgi:hypothetical protein